MNPAQVIGGFLSGFVSYLQAKRTQHEIDSAFDAISAVNDWLARTMTAIATYQQQEQGAVKFSAANAQQVGHDFEQIQGTQQAWIDRILDVILPHSFAHLVGFVYSDGIVPLRVDLRFVHSTLDGLLTWQSKIAAWVDNVAVPTLADYQNFKAFLLRNWAPPVNTLADWLANPGIFGSWAAAPITGPVIAYLADPAHAQSRDNLARIMVGAWTEVPNDVWELILQWSVT